MKRFVCAFVGALSLMGYASAGSSSWCPPSKGNVCEVDCCPDIGASVGVEYLSDYFFRGVRLHRDSLAASVNFTFENLAFKPTFGVRHVTSLGSNGLGQIGANGLNIDHTNIHASLALPEVLGFSPTLRYDQYYYSTLRSSNNGLFDSHGMLGLTLSRDLGSGLGMYFGSAYDFQWPGSISPVFNSTDNGAWVHYLGASYNRNLTDSIGLSLGASVFYSDNQTPGGSNSQRSSGWHSYYVEAGLPIALNCRAKLTPYLGYNGTPDTWLADGVSLVPGGNSDALLWGVRLGIDF